MIKNRVFLKFLSTYVLIIAIPLALGTFINNAVVREFIAHVEQSHLAFLHQTRDIIERYTNEIEWSVFQIAGNTGLSRLHAAHEEGAAANAYLLKEIIDDFNTYLLYTSSFNTTFYVYCRDAGIILTPHSVYSYADFVGGKDFFQTEGLPTETWHDRLYQRYYDGVFLPARRVTVEDFRNREMIPYIQSLPAAYGGSLDDVEAVVVYFIGEAEFTGLLENIDIPPGGWAYIADADNRIITGISNRGDTLAALTLPPDKSEGLQVVSYGGEEMYIIYTKTHAGWRYVTVLPSAWVLADIDSLQRMSLLTLLISIVVCMAIASFAAYRRSGPLKRMLVLLSEFFSGDTKSRISFRSLDSSVSRLIDRNRSMQEQLHKQMDFVHAAFLNRLLHGYFRSQRDLDLFLRYLGIAVSESRFLVVLIAISGYEQLASIAIIDELNKTKVLLKNALRQSFTDRSFIYDLEENQLAVLIMSGAGGEEECRVKIKESLQKLLAASREFIKSPLCIGVGDIYPNLFEINRSLEDAKEALSFRVKAGGNQIIWFAEIEQELQEYYYPIELEMRLINATKAGDRDHVSSIFAILERENTRNRKLPPEDTRHLYYEVESTLTKIRGRLSGYGKPEKTRGETGEPGDYSLSRLIGRYLEICAAINEHKKSHNSRLIGKIAEYIASRYSDPNLSLTSVASEFSITESYLSFFYKEQTGANFSWQVEKLRLDAAVDLLKTTRLSINEIARSVGYHSDKTFRRVFKRAKGSSPNEYRQDYLLNKIV